MGINYQQLYAFLNRWVFRKRLKEATLMAWLIATGRSFQSFGATAVNEWSPRVARVLILGC